MWKKKILIGTLLCVFVTFGLLVPSSAAVRAPGDMLFGPDTEDALTINPHSGPNGEYAYLDENEELTILVTDPERGLNVDSVYVFEDVFTITNTGERPASVFLTHNAMDSIHFYTDNGSIQSATNETVLPPNRTIAVGFVVDTRSVSQQVLLEDVIFTAKWTEPGSFNEETPSNEENSLSEPSTDSSEPEVTPTSTDTETGRDSQSVTSTQRETEGSSSKSSGSSNNVRNGGIEKPPTDDQTDEVAGLGPSALLGILLLLAAVLATMLLFRRLRGA